MNFKKLYDTVQIGLHFCSNDNRLIEFFHFYHPLSKDGEGTVFTGVSMSTPGKRGIPKSQVLSQVTGPRYFLVGGDPSPGQVGVLQ